MWGSGRRAASGVVAGAIVIALAGCGESHRARAPAEKKATVAEACKQHRAARGAVVGGLVLYKTYMDSADPAFRLTFADSGIPRKVESAIQTLKEASGAAASTTSGLSFFNDLDGLEGRLKAPVAVPSPVIGDRHVSQIEGAAKAVGCPL
jgi:hypothetical protein